MSPDRPVTHNSIGNVLNTETNMVVSLPMNVSPNTVLVLNNHNIISSSQPTINTVGSSTTCYNNIQQHNLNDSPTNYNITKMNDSIKLNNNLSSSNNHGNIVVLATQQLEPTQNSNDEELTPLTWLHDKNLLKEINFSCPKERSITGSPHNNHLSPTSDFLEDSCISEENSSANSNSDNGILLSPVESTASSTIYYHTKNNIITTNKNRSALSSPNSVSSFSSSPSSTSSSPSSLSVNSSLNMSPNRQSNIEYQTNNNNNNNNNNDPTALNKNNLNQNSGNVIVQTVTPHQHFHKKYLREEHVKTLKQNAANNTTPNHVNINNNQQIISSPIKTEIIQSNCNSPQKIIIPYQRNNQNDVLNSYNSSIISRQSLQQDDLTVSNTVMINSNKMAVSTSPSKQKNSSNVAYDPQVHTHNKPPFSFSSLIFMAIEDSPEKALPVKEIYAWIVQHFPYFKTAPTGWKNSVRHNLSLSKSFQKVEKAPNMGKGSLWRVDQHYRHNLVQTVTRSQFHPCATIEKTSMKSILRPSDITQMDVSELNLNNSNNINGRPLNAELFPRLSKCIAEYSSIAEHSDRPSPASTPPDEDYQTTYQNYEYISNRTTDITNNNNISTINHNNINTNNNIINNNNNNLSNKVVINGNFSPEKLARDYGVENIDDVNAATAMLALKHGPKIFSENFHSPVITSSPSEDHTYSQGGVPNNTARSVQNSDNNSNGTSSDAAYESSDEFRHCNSNINYCKYNNQRHITSEELEEQRRKAEGVDALLNLAGVTVTSPIILKRQSTTALIEVQPFTTEYTNGTTQITLNTPNLNTINTIYQHSPPKKYKTKTLRNKLKKKVWMR